MLSKEEKQLKEAMKILLRDGRNGKLFDAALARYVSLKTDDRIKNLANEIPGVDWTAQYNDDIKTLDCHLHKNPKRRVKNGE